MTEGRDLDLAGLLAELRRRVWLIALCTLAAAGLAFGISGSSSTSATRRPPSCSSPRSNPNAPERTAATNLALASLDSVMFRVKPPARQRRADRRAAQAVRPRTARAVRHRQGEREGPMPEEAAKFANIFAEAGRRDAPGARAAGDPAPDRRARRASSRRAGTSSAHDPGPRGAAPRARPSRRRSRPATSRSPTPPCHRARRAAPRPLRYTRDRRAARAAAPSIALVFALRAVQRRVDEKEVSRIFKAPILARVPPRRRRAWREQLYLEAFEFLRANVATRLAKRGDGGRRRRAPDRDHEPAARPTARARWSPPCRMRWRSTASEVLAIDCDLRKPALAAGVRAARRRQRPRRGAAQPRHPGATTSSRHRCRA